MSEQVFLSIPLERLKNELSQAIKSELSSLLTPPPQISETHLLTRKEASKLLGISLPTLLQWTKTGKVTGYRISSRVRYKRHELESSLSKIKTGR